MLSSYLSLLILLPTLSSAFSFNFESTPRQCQTLSISITGSGQPPYSVLILPFGPSPLANNTEVRKIFQSNFTGDSTSHSFLLSYPESSQFVAVVSDSTGFGSGGTSGAVAVLSSNDSSCYNVNQGVQPDFFYSLVPNSLTQCAATRIWWDPTAGVQGTPSFQGVIPGGQSFIVPQGSLTTVAEQGLGFNWSPSVRAGTTMVFVASDDRGPGTGGSSTYIVNFGDNGCLNDQSPSSTAGNPAGGSYPTSTSGAGIGNSDTHHTDVGAIVGGVIGGLVGLVSILLIVLFFIRRNRFHKSQNSRPVDLLNDQEGDGEPDGNLPQYYRPEPFIVPDPTVSSSYGGDPETRTTTGLRPSLDGRSRYSGTTADLLRPDTPDRSATSGSTAYMRKSPAPPSFRPVNIIQHDDAGPSEDAPETIELPPAYTHIKREPHPPAPETTD
ncbi:hypothetical protein EW026_g5230 [Hermanssonia centrifuga]|uniref:Uncharacterized protein n=1 Tax=Hermanssonia centrifuga TaxID=98765 RepID=A0A4S4KEZ4_9APHY|nr:hypothetical protein EW026_g5230 [Hermanssonia centrifuga]